jgi:hypothetical protein
MEGMMRIVVGLLNAVAVFLALAAQAPSAKAQPVWVASNGLDVNPCSRASPCATFSKAVTLTNFSEIRCADTGVYGGVVITRSLTINCEDGMGSGLGPGETITVTTAATDIVLLKGLDINGARFGWSSGTGGIVFDGAGLLRVEKVTLGGFLGSGSGLVFKPTGPAKLIVVDSTLGDNAGGNILIRPTGNAAAAAQFDRVRASGGLFGIKADGSGQTSGIIDVDVRDSIASHNGNNGFIAASVPGQAEIRFKITRSSAFNNAAYGAVASGAQAFMIVSDSSLTANGTGLAQLSGATVATYGNNDINFNTTNVTGAITPIQRQ